MAAHSRRSTWTRHARNLEAHAECESGVREVERVGWFLAGKFQSADALLVISIVEVRVAQRVRGVSEQPGDEHCNETQGAQRGRGAKCSARRITTTPAKRLKTLPSTTVIPTTRRPQIGRAHA